MGSCSTPWMVSVCDCDGLGSFAIHTPEKYLKILPDDMGLDYESSCVKRWYDRNKPFKICGSTTLEDIVSMQGNCSSNISSAENDAMAKYEHESA